MAKLRNRIFEIYDHRDEAGRSLLSKAAPPEFEGVDPAELNYDTLHVSREATVICVGFTVTSLTTTADAASLREDLARLVESLPRGSKVLLDFAHVDELSAAMVGILIDFDKLLRPKGSRMAICELSEDIRAAFFDAMPPSTPSISLSPKRKPRSIRSNRRY